MEIINRKVIDLIPYDKNPRKNDEAVKYVRERVCIDCGKIDTIRKDSKAVRCRHCSAKIGNRMAQITFAKNRNTEICAECGEIFFSPKSNQQKYCSIKCLSESQKRKHLTRTCRHCGKEFEIYASALKTNASSNFCSTECYHTWMSDDEYTNGRGSRWKTKSREVRERTPFCCLCGRTQKLEVHHIIPYRLTQDNSQQNLVPLCKRCHTRFEHITRSVLSTEPPLEMSKMILRNILDVYKMTQLARRRPYAK